MVDPEEVDTAVTGGIEIDTPDDTPCYPDMQDTTNKVSTLMWYCRSQINYFVQAAMLNNRIIVHLKRKVLKNRH